MQATLLSVLKKSLILVLFFTLILNLYLGHFFSCFPPLALPRSLFLGGTANSGLEFHFIVKFICVVSYTLYLVVVDEVNEDLHDT